MSKTRSRTIANALAGSLAGTSAPSRPIRLMSIAAVSCIELVSVSGCAAIRRSKLPSPQFTNPSGAFFFTSLRLAFGSMPGLGGAAGVLDLVLGRLGDDVPGDVVPGAAGPPGDLVELAGAQLPHPDAVVFGERGEQHGADRHVDADAERVGAADHPQQPALRERLDEPAVLRQHAGVVDADSGAHQAVEGRTEPRREPEPADRLADRIPLLARRDLGARQRLRPLDRGGLREVHDVDGGEAVGEQLFDGLVHGRHHVPVVEGYRALDAGDLRDLASGAALEVGGQVGEVAERRRHEHELRARQQ